MIGSHLAAARRAADSLEHARTASCHFLPLIINEGALHCDCCVPLVFDVLTENRRKPDHESEPDARQTCWQENFWFSMGRTREKLAKVREPLSTWTRQASYSSSVDTGGDFLDSSQGRYL